MTQIQVQALIVNVCDDLRDFLLEKNEAYGNSALDPVRVFSKASAEEQLLVRIDDKLSRLARGGEYPGDDTLQDLLGYLVLLQVSRRIDALASTQASAAQNARLNDFLSRLSK